MLHLSIKSIIATLSKALLLLALLIIPLLSHAALQMHLKLDGDLTDSSGNGNNGVFPGGSNNPGYASAIINQGLHFDGNDYIRVPSFNPGSTFTVSLWVRLNNINSLNTFIEYVKTNNRNDFYLGYDRSLNQLFVELEDNNTTEGGPCGNPKFCTGIQLITNRWYQLTVTVTPSTLKVYVDGTLAYNITHSISVVSNPGTWLIGADSDSPLYTTANNDYLNGLLDDIRVYDRELSQAEINNIIGLQAFLPFDLCNISPGTSITDASGNGHNGTAYGGVSSTAGVICTAASFDGSTGYVEIPDNASLNGSSELTYSAWINPSSWSGINQIMAKSIHGGGTGRAQMGIFSESGVLKGRAEALGGRYEVSAPLPSTNNWHHVALVFAGDRLTLYVDGVVPSGSATRTFTPTTLVQTNDPLDISKRVGSSQYYFHGLIDEVKVFNRAQAAQEILDYKNDPDPLGRTCPVCTPSGNLLAYYKMDSGSWTGIPNEVLDASGNNNNASTVNGVTTVANGKVCRAGSIDSNGKAIDTGLDLDSAIGSAGTVSFWFRPNWTNSGSERNNSRVLFDASLGNKYFKFAKTRNASGPPNAWRSKLILLFEDSSDRDVAVYSSDLSVFQANTWVHLAVTWDYPNKKFEIYVNGSRVASQLRNSNGNATSTLGPIPNLDTLYLGDNRSTYNPYNITSPANGTFDEVYIYNSVRTQAEIQGNMNATHSCGGLDHIRIEHDGTALTCNPESVTIKACDSADCTALHADPVSVTLGPTGWVGGDTQTILGGTGVLQLRETTAGLATLGIISSAPAAANPAECYNTATATIGDCNLNFHDSGFIYSVPNITACQTSTSFTIQAVRKDASSQLCVPAFQNRTANVNIWTTYTNPNSGTKQARLTHNLITTTLPTSPPGTSVSLNFDASAKATVTINYDDAGQLSLNSAFSGTGSEAGLYMTGSSTFVSRPGAIYVYSTDTNSDCVAGDATCTAFRKTGQSFNLKVRAACNNGPTYTSTPNFRINNVALTTTNIAPAVNNGVLGVSSVNFDAAANGEVVVPNQTLSEVGVFTITATPPALGYFGLTVNPGTSANIGRFTPDHFFMTTPLLTNRTDLAACMDPFTYMDEDFRLAYTLQARNSSNAITQNYTGSFAKLDPQTNVAAFNYGASFNNTDYSARLSSNHTGSSLFVNGTASIQNTMQLARALVLDGPLNPIAIGIAPQDSDGTLMQSYDLSLNGGVNTHTQLINNANLRYGRFNIENAFGPQTTNLPIPAQAQYYDGTNFILNTNDSCTIMNAGLIGFDLWTDKLSVGDTQIFSINNPALQAGDAALVLTAPDSLNTLDSNNGSVRITATLPSYLQYDWDASGAIRNPTGIATFGIYRGDDRIIFWQEIQN